MRGRFAHSSRRGRYGTPAEVALRMLGLKHLKSWSYEQLQWEVTGHLVYRHFCRIDGGKVLGAKTMVRLGQLLEGEALRGLLGLSVFCAAATCSRMNVTLDLTERWTSTSTRAAPKPERSKGQKCRLARSLSMATAVRERRTRGAARHDTQGKSTSEPRETRLFGAAVEAFVRRPTILSARRLLNRRFGSNGPLLVEVAIVSSPHERPDPRRAPSLGDMALNLLRSSTCLLGPESRSSKCA